MSNSLDLNETPWHTASHWEPSCLQMSSWIKFFRSTHKGDFLWIFHGPVMVTLCLPGVFMAKILRLITKKVTKKTHDKPLAVKYSIVSLEIKLNVMRVNEQI